MEIALLVAFIVSNIAWLWHMKHKDEVARAERWELYERIRKPELGVIKPIEAIPAAQQTDIKQAVEVDEFDLVGKIDPPLPLRNEG